MMNHITRFLSTLTLAIMFSLTAGAQTVRVGVMLPLHDINGDGRRMVEYYRGILMACDSLRGRGYSIDVHAWNTPEDCDMKQILRDPDAARCNIIVGPLYSRQVRALSDFVTQHDIKLFIPFSIMAPPLYTNPNIYQVYQNANDFNAHTISHFLERFAGYHPVLIDCNDSTSKKGSFTFALRRKLEERGIAYNLTNLKSAEQPFMKAFSRTQPNVVILNTGRSAELGVALAKLRGLKSVLPDLNISILGYTEWLGYTRLYLDQFYRFNVHIPSPFYYDQTSTKTRRFQQKYRWNFHQDMQQGLPRFGMTGFDHAMFFLQDLIGRGTSSPLQTPLRFERIGNGGWRNRTHLFVHYGPDQRIETIKF